MRRAALFAGISVTLLIAPTTFAQDRTPSTPVVWDTDFGTEIDDTLALAFLLGSPKVELRAVTSVGADATKRAMMLCRFLTMTGRRTPVGVGADPQPERPITRMHPYYYHPDVLFDRTRKPESRPAADLLHARLAAQPGQVTILATGPLTNVAKLLEKHADAKKLVRRIVLRESNLSADVPAARTVLASGVPIVCVADAACGDLTLDRDDAARVLGVGTPLSWNAKAMYQLWDEGKPAPLGDVLAAALVADSRFFESEEAALGVDDDGSLRRRPDGPKNATLVTKVDHEAFTKWYVERMAALVPPAKRPSQPVERGGMPARVHVAENFDTDIERRWWISGIPEETSVPPGGVRACRSILTHDFDALLMPSRKMYAAVVFNPVPGPPMGPNTRLGFRYKLSGTETLRVQIYSLTNGYHRHLVLEDLPTDEWQALTVDMTDARRPDGTGGPLGEDERIDDIQFYVDPDATVLIDDVVLYDAAPEDEKRPFPRSIVFTAGFDTGRQGREWPGKFKIVPHEAPLKWKRADSVKDEVSGLDTIRIGMRGRRTLPNNLRLRLMCRVTKPVRLAAVMMDDKAGTMFPGWSEELPAGRWVETTIAFRPHEGKLPRYADTISLSNLKGSFSVDDVLLYEPR